MGDFVIGLRENDVRKTKKATKMEFLRIRKEAEKDDQEAVRQNNKLKNELVFNSEMFAAKLAMDFMVFEKQVNESKEKVASQTSALVHRLNESLPTRISRALKAEEKSIDRYLEATKSRKSGESDNVDSDFFVQTDDSETQRTVKSYQVAAQGINEEITNDVSKINDAAKEFRNALRLFQLSVGEISQKQYNSSF